jgi:hypothetical protein
MGIWELSALGGLAAIGVLHGINPAMGWLFAVFFALHRGGQRALWLALGAWWPWPFPWRYCWWPAPLCPSGRYAWLPGRGHWP